MRERIKAGDSDQEVVDFIVARYGEFVLLKPRFEPRTLLLWFATPAVFLLALLLIALAYRRRKIAPEQPAPLSVNEQQRLRICSTATELSAAKKTRNLPARRHNLTEI